MYKLYEFASSGNCYKLRLAMHVLEIHFERIQVDITRGESRTSKFLEINPNGKVPVLETPEGQYLPESNAALWYITSSTDLMPDDQLDQAKVLQWMFFEQYSHEPFIATSRYWIHILGQEAKFKNQLKDMRVKGYAALDLMESHLEKEEYFVAGKISAADIALYAYTHVAHEGGFRLAKYTAVNEWFSRIKTVKNYVSIDS